MCEQGREYVLLKSKMRKCKSMCPHIRGIDFSQNVHFHRKKPTFFLGNKNCRILPKISLN